MKLVKLASLGLGVAIVILGGGTVLATDVGSDTSNGTVVLKADEVNPEGNLTIDQVGKFDFGTQKLESSAKTYSLTESGEMLKTTDKRGTGAGWNVQVKLGDFIDTTDKAKMLKGVTLNLVSVGEPTTDAGNVSKSPTYNSVALDPTDTNIDIFSAKKDAGMGTWAVEFDQSKTTLKVASGNYVGDYSAVLTWTLSDAPL